MKAVKKIIFAISVIVALAFNASANVQWQGQDKKPPEKVKEQPKPDKKDERRDNDRKDDKKNDNKKKPE